MISSTLSVGHLLHDELLNPNIETNGPTFLESAKFSSPLGADFLEGTKDDNYQLTPTSPGIGAGNVLAIPRDFADLDGDGNRSEPTPYDALGAPRVKSSAGNLSVDLGAFEFPIPTSLDTLPELPSTACFEVYPNPFSSELHVAIGPSKSSSIEIIDMMGRRLIHENAKAGVQSFKFSTDNWPVGAYLIRSGLSRDCVRLITHL